MFGLSQTNEAGVEDDVWGLLMQLKANTPASVLSQRTSSRLELRISVLLRPGNASERHVEAIPATSADISEGGCQLVLDRPIWVGDFFLLEFDRAHLDIDPVMARCLRCRLLTEHSFECGFKFSTAIEINR